MLPGRRPSLLDGGYPPPPATYPGATERATPGPAAPARPLRGLAPGEVYPAGRSPGRWWALTPPLHPYRMLRRYVSVALSVGLPRLGITQHLALWSSDFPRAGLSARGRPACLDHRSPYQSDAVPSTPEPSRPALLPACGRGGWGVRGHRTIIRGQRMETGVDAEVRQALGLGQFVSAPQAIRDAAKWRQQLIELGQHAQDGGVPGRVLAGQLADDRVVAEHKGYGRGRERTGIAQRQCQRLQLCVQSGGAAQVPGHPLAHDARGICDDDARARQSWVAPCHP